MKKIIGIGVMVLSALLAGCGNNDSPRGVANSATNSSDTSNSATNPLSDAQIRQKAVGTWKLDANPTNNLTFNSDGSASTSDGEKGFWKVTNGLFILMEGTEDNETGQVVRIDDHELIFQDPGTTNATILRK
jgi:hypothetical protein